MVPNAILILSNTHKEPSAESGKELNAQFVKTEKTNRHTDMH